MIIFNYKISDFISNVQVLSLFRGVSVLEKGSDNLLDDSTISDEDEPLLKKYLKAGCAIIAYSLSGYTKDLINSAGDTVLMEGEPFEFDATYDEVEHSIVFRINMPETFKEKVIILMDEAIKDALENYVLYRVAKQKNMESETYFQSWEDARGLVTMYLSQRTKPTIRRYNYF